MHTFYSQLKQRDVNTWGQLSSDAKHKIAINHVSTIVECMGCDWHDKSEKAFGLDGEIELKRRGQRAGRILMVQVKSGPSYLKKKTQQELVFDVERKYLEYWKNHLIPVLFIWYNPDQRKAYWTCANSKSLYSEHCEIHVPKSSKFGTHSLPDLRRVAMDLYGPENLLPMIQPPSDLAPKMSTLKEEAWAFYSKWRSEGCFSPAFGQVLITLRGWRHLTASWRTQRSIVRKLQLLPSARTILESLDVFHIQRTLTVQTSKGARERRLYEQTAIVRYPERRDGVISVITEKLGDEPVRFYSVYEHPKRERGDWLLTREQRLKHLREQVTHMLTQERIEEISELFKKESRANHGV